MFGEGVTAVFALRFCFSLVVVDVACFLADSSCSFKILMTSSWPSSPATCKGVSTLSSRYLSLQVREGSAL